MEHIFGKNKSELSRHISVYFYASLAAPFLHCQHLGPCSSSKELPLPADPSLDKGGVGMISALLKEGQPKKQKHQGFYY